MDSAATAIRRSVKTARAPVNESLATANRRLHAALDEVAALHGAVKRVHIRLDALDRYGAALDLVNELRDGTPLLVLDDEIGVLRRLCKLLCLRVRMFDADVCTKLRSCFTVTKDCGVAEVGWDDLGPHTEWDLELDDEKEWARVAGRALEFDDCRASPGVLGLSTADLRVGDVDYDGDHHGVWAWAKARHFATVVVKAPGSVYARFRVMGGGALDRRGRARVHVSFSSKLGDESDVDVSSALDDSDRCTGCASDRTGECECDATPPAYEGVLLPWNGDPPRYANEEDAHDCINGDPAVGDWFWSWKELAAEYVRGVADAIKTVLKEARD